jgi:hypothetical protein
MRTSYLACGPVDPGRSVSGNCEPVVATMRATGPYPTTITLLLTTYSSSLTMRCEESERRGPTINYCYSAMTWFKLTNTHVLPVALHGMFKFHAPSPVVLRRRSLRPAAMRSPSTNFSGNYAGLYSSRVSNYAVVFSQQHR